MEWIRSERLLPLLHRLTHQILFDLVNVRYTGLGNNQTAFEQLGFHLACCLSSQFPKTRFDVLVWQVATVYLLANFETPPEDKFV